MLEPHGLCAVVAAPTALSMEKQVRESLRLTHTIELRLDWLQNGKEIDRFLKRIQFLPIQGATLIATCRRRAAGGRFKGSVAEELCYLARAVNAGCKWYDLAIESARKCPPELLAVLLGTGKRLVSAHFFKGMPGNLEKVASNLNGVRPDAVKIAANCETLGQAMRLLEFAAKRKKVIAIPMGELALPARFLALRAKMGLAYAPVENATAPGQVSLFEMKQVYHADRIDRDTQVYGVIGDPIGHSLSPVMHNAAFEARRRNAIYLPFRVRDLKDFVASVPALGVRGFSVTIPHKERIIRYLDGCDVLAQKIGAVNTVVVRGGGKLHGYNTDYIGVLRSLERRSVCRSLKSICIVLLFHTAWTRLPRSSCCIRSRPALVSACGLATFWPA